MSIRNYNLLLLFGHLIGAIIAFIYGVINDQGGVGFGYIIVGLSIIGLLSLIFIIFGIFKFKLFIKIDGPKTIIPIIIFLISIWEIFLLRYLSIF